MINIYLWLKLRNIIISLHVDDDDDDDDISMIGQKIYNYYFFSFILVYIFY
jgi:hypothetical protein